MIEILIYDKKLRCLRHCQRTDGSKSYLGKKNCDASDIVRGQHRATRPFHKQASGSKHISWESLGALVHTYVSKHSQESEFACATFRDQDHFQLRQNAKRL